MKKVIIVLLSVLLLLSVVLAFICISCEKTKSGKVIQNYQDFMGSYNANKKISSFCSNLILKYQDAETRNVDNKEFEKDDNETILSLLQSTYKYENTQPFIDLLDVNATSITIKSVESVSGNIQGTYNDYTISDLVIKFKYTTPTYVYNPETKTGTTKESDPVEIELKINIKYSRAWSDGIETLSISSFSLQGVSYRDITYIMDNYKGVVTSATVGGEEVELRLLNAVSEMLSNRNRELNHLDQKEQISYLSTTDEDLSSLRVNTKAN